MPRHFLAEHTGELEVRLEAANLGELFSEAARALAEIMAGAAVAPSGGSGELDRLEVSIRAPDRDALLVDWLNELIYISERDKKVFEDIRIEQISEQDLTASVRGREIEDLKLQVKAATYHGLKIEEAAAGLVTANVVLDV